MIVNSNADGWEIFSHSAHGLLAGKIADQLKPDIKGRNWVATLTAIVEHDDRQLNFREKDYLTNIGTPQDFLDEDRNINEIIKRSRRLLEQAKLKSSWVTILVMKHLEFLYKDLSEESKMIHRFMNEIREEIKKLMKVNSMADQEVHDLYQIMVFADRCSLILCQNGVPAKNRELEINTSIQNTKYVISRNEADDIFIEPWIFEQDSFELSCEYKMLEKASFSGNKEFEDCLRNTPISLRHWKISKLK
ncbi:DUF3891 family protein [Christiangramia sp. OXR-203]|jgi:hypothetical protein|uniref:DUF3891 family protein n=1 Tax=Christiangramia sp. OXR-203 TaxID=3100176 RepID=UPI002AC974E2|nr:DUF3891 family protein [Christiangramia sp. OXR-203]WPY99803.1 DUF3891 family protein [Christiangramia sp. OXR-203]